MSGLKASKATNALKSCLKDISLDTYGEKPSRSLMAGRGDERLRKENFDRL